ncbi:ShlB/FhaC/HecB family hemolysin secretion/activation protein [Litorisediminicola beolgyonensis]|uniref:ShlB/FhaC/HecB family hemolysin secretion/activation protein n=1 Tax=Litorisediminicola beolgyonensis TaxID=1173614 RepID=A0ABW3ZEP8_9RHOB
MKHVAMILAASCSIAVPYEIGAQTRDGHVQFNITGVTHYDPAELLGFASHLVLERTGRTSIGDLAQTVETIYLEDGYFLAEVFIADDGHTLVVDEGEIGTLSIEGVDADTARLIRAYMSPVVAKRGVTLKEFERAIMLVEDIESVTASAEFDYPPGQAHAHARIVAEAVDTRFGSVTLDHPSREIGETLTLSLSQTYLSALTPGDLLRFDLAGNAGYDGESSSLWGAATYRLPLGGSGAFAEGYLGTVTAERDASGALQQTDILGHTALLALGYPVVRDVETYGYGLLELRRSSSDVDVEGQSFDSTVDAVSAGWIFGKALETGGAYEYALNLTHGRQRDDSGAQTDGDETFSYLRFGFGYEHPVGWFGPDSTVRAELWGQASSDQLPSIEEFHLGGRWDERGYLFAEAQGDSGYSATLEVSRDLFPGGGTVQRLRPYGFVDIGRVSNNDATGDEAGDIELASLGLGLDLEFSGGFLARTYVATPLKDGADTEAGDPALYLGLTKSW